MVKQAWASKARSAEKEAVAEEHKSRASAATGETNNTHMHIVRGST